MTHTARTVIATSDAPAAIGPYSQAIVANGMVFCSGQIALDPRDNSFDAGASVEAQAERVLSNLDAVLRASGATLADVVRTTVFLLDMADFAAVNAVYAKHFTESPPARATVAVQGLPRGAKVEIDAIALLRAR
ncbi:MAG: RidA family protein [Deltaproteobacteria bacterium]|nr:RidA family protein [Deltaproteobacteria bacterium]